ncbi:MAG: hypothetical protein M3430_19855 [Acidobacteriota bacterium]|nr:hypothetical protein [Acidobacteriota bacterium]
MGDETDTGPTLDTILERINVLGNELRGDIASLREDMNMAFRKMEDKIDVLNQNILEVRADYRDLKRRMESLEKRAA